MMTQDLAVVPALVATLPHGVALRWSGAALRCRPVDTSESELANLPPGALAAELERRGALLELSGLSGLAQWWRLRLLKAALEQSRVRPERQGVSGLRLVRSLWERIGGGDAAPETPGAEGDDRQRLALWARCVEACPAPALPEFLQQFEARRWEGTIAWIAGALLYFDAKRAGVLQRVPTIHEAVSQELTVRDGFAPLLALAACRPPARAPDPTAEHRRNLRFLGELTLRTELVGSAPAYRSLSIEARPPAAARILVGIPEHLAETGQAGACAWWPAASAGLHVDFERRFGAMLPAEFQTWSPGIAAHPLVSTKTTAQQGHTVCVADSTTLLGSRLAARFPDDPGRVAAEQLLCLRNGLLYGVHARLGTPVYQPYSKSVIAPDTSVPLLPHDRAVAVARARGLQLVPWER